MTADPPALPRTEQPSAEHAGLDTLPLPELVHALSAHHARAVEAVLRAGPQLTRAAELALPRLRAGGRLVYAGAGTSGRLGVLDGVELLPTFSWPRERLATHIAGGERAMFRAVEGAEDREELGEADMAEVGPNDVVIVLAASGATPYALAAARTARERGALVIGLANNPGSPLAALAHAPVELDTGPEIISGSTRLGAGTAQKIALNTLSSTLMVRLGKVYGNLMVDVQATNAKLRRRALHLTRLATGAGEEEAGAALEAAGMHVKTAVVMLRLGVPVEEARARLDAAAGVTARALEIEPSSR